MTALMMLDWIANSQAGYVLAAYGIAAVALIGLALASWREFRRLAKEWRALSTDLADSDR